MNHGRLLLRARSAPWPFLECRGRSVLVHHSPAGSCSFSHLIRKSLPRTSPKVDQNRHLVSATPSLQQQETGSDSSLPQPPHVSVLLDETLAAFEDMRVATYVDGTLGAAGHAIGMVQQHPELTTLIGFDLDTTAHRIAGERLASVGAHLVPVEPRRNAAGKVVSIPPIQTTGASPQPTAYVVHSNFESMQTILSRLPSPENPLAACSSDGGLVGAVDAVLLDLGMSSMQVRQATQQPLSMAGCMRLLHPFTSILHGVFRPVPTCTGFQACGGQHSHPKSWSGLHLCTYTLPCHHAPRLMSLTVASASCVTARWTCAWTPRRVPVLRTW